MNLTIDAKSPLPVYQQVIQAIKLDILSGGLRDGDLLPSIRDLARLLQQCSHTVLIEYNDSRLKESSISGEFNHAADIHGSAATGISDKNNENA